MKRLFYLSLILLSVAMGQNWYKNRPKTPKKIHKAVQTAVNLDELASGTASQPGDLATASGGEKVGSETAAVASESLPASAPEEIASGTASSPAELDQGDPVLLAWKELPRSPFEPSPFLKMMAEAGKSTTASGTVEAVVVKKKPTQLLPGPFAGILETDKDYSAIIGGKLFKNGEKYNEKNIKKVESQYLTLEDEAAIYIMPKRGVSVSLATDGTIIGVVEGFKKF